MTGGQDNTISVIAFEGGKTTMEKSWKANCVWAVHALAVNSEEDVCVSGGNSDKVHQKMTWTCVSVLEHCWARKVV